MPTFEITISKTFAAAHAIYLYDGELEPVHGHNWPVDVTVAADKLDEIGVVMDFHVLETLVDGLIAQLHNRNVNDVPPFVNADDPAGKLAINTTAERIAEWIGCEVAKGLPAHARLVSVRLGEAPGCAATYRP